MTSVGADGAHGADGAGSATATHIVTEADTAIAVGSGSLPVLGTPRLLAWCEAATCAALDPHLAEGQTSVGTRVDLEHLAASPLGQQVEVSARVVYGDGRLRRFAVTARHRPAGETGATSGPGKLVANGEITRVVVDAERFLGRLG